MLPYEIAAQTTPSVYSPIPLSSFLDQQLYETSPIHADANMPINGKLGLCALGGSETVLQHATGDRVGWWYTYQTWVPDETQIDWANKNKIEFVPMIGYHQVTTQGWKKCDMVEDPDHPEWKCDVNDLIDQLDKTQAQLDVKMQYLLGFNEPWDTNWHLKWKKYIAPEDAAKYWAEYFMPISKATGLKLVSPSTTMKTNVDQFGWFVKFVQTCWELDDCDVETIDVIAMHHYTCFHDEMVDTYDVNSTSSKSFYQKLIKELTDASWKGHDQFDWKTWALGLPIWFTEHSCSGEHWEGK